MVLRAAGFVIFRRLSNNIQFLFLRTSYGEKHWTPPKGHVDPGETDEQTAYRETLEESGLSNKDLKVYLNTKYTLEYNVNNKPKVVIYWLAEVIDPNAKVKLSSEHTEYKWLAMDEIDVFAKYEDMQKLLRHYNDLIIQNKL